MSDTPAASGLQRMMMNERANTPAEVVRARELLEAATPGPWDWITDGSYGEGVLATCLYRDTPDSDETVLEAGRRMGSDSFDDEDPGEPVIVVPHGDKAFIAAAPTLVTNLIAALEATVEREGSLRAALERIANDVYDSTARDTARAALTPPPPTKEGTPRD